MMTVVVVVVVVVDVVTTVGSGLNSTLSSMSYRGMD
jgi:hypothetical protein